MSNTQFLEKAVLECKNTKELEKLVNKTFSPGSAEFLIWSTVVEQLKNPSGAPEDNEVKLLKSLDKLSPNLAEALRIKRDLMKVNPKKSFVHSSNSGFFARLGVFPANEKSIKTQKDQNTECKTNKGEGSGKGNKGDAITSPATSFMLDIPERLKKFITGKDELKTIDTRDISKEECWEAFTIINEMLIRSPTSYVNSFLIRDILKRCPEIANNNSVVNVIRCYCASTNHRAEYRNATVQLKLLGIMSYLTLSDLELFGKENPNLFADGTYIAACIARYHPQTIEGVRPDSGEAKRFYEAVVEKLGNVKTRLARQLVRTARCGLLALSLETFERHFDVNLFKAFLKDTQSCFEESIGPRGNADAYKQKSVADLLSSLVKNLGETRFCDSIITPPGNLQTISEVSHLPLFSSSCPFLQDVQTSVVTPYLEYVIFLELLDNKNKLPSASCLHNFLFLSEWNRFFRFGTFVGTVLDVLATRTNTTALELFSRYNDLRSISDSGLLGAKVPESNGTPKIAIERDVEHSMLQRDTPLCFTVVTSFVRDLDIAVYEIAPFELLDMGLTANDAINLELAGFQPSFHKEFTLPPTVADWRTTRTRVVVTPTTSRAVLVVVVSGGGLSARVAAQIGHVHLVQRPFPRGSLFYVLDEEGHPIKGCTLHVSGSEYKEELECDPNDEVPPIVLPLRNPKEVASSFAVACAEVPNTLFSQERKVDEVALRGDCDHLVLVEQEKTDTGGRPIIPFATSSTFDFKEEEYALSTAFFLDWESLGTGSTGAIRCNAKLRLTSGCPAPFSVIGNARAEIVSVDSQGTRDVTAFERLEEVLSFLRGDRGFGFRPIDDLSSVTIQLEVHIRRQSTGERQSILAGHTFKVIPENRRSSSSEVSAVCLLSYDVKGCGEYTPGYVLAVLDPSGTPFAGTTVLVTAEHTCSASISKITTITDDNGLIYLGELKGVGSITVECQGSTDGTEVSQGGIQGTQALFRLNPQLTGPSFKLPTFANFVVPQSNQDTTVCVKTEITLVAQHSEASKIVVTRLGFKQAPVVAAQEGITYNVVSNCGEMVRLKFEQPGVFRVTVRDPLRCGKSFIVTVLEGLTLNNFASGFQLGNQGLMVRNAKPTDQLGLIPIASEYVEENKCYVITFKGKSRVSELKAIATCSRFVQDGRFAETFVRPLDMSVWRDGMPGDSGSFDDSDDEPVVSFPSVCSPPIISQAMKLGDEEEYIKERHKLETAGQGIVGCSLHRPGLIISRHKESETNNITRRAECADMCMNAKMMAAEEMEQCSVKRKMAKVMCSNGKLSSGTGKEKEFFPSCRVLDYLPLKGRPLVLEGLHVSKGKEKNTYTVSIPEINVSDAMLVDLAVRGTDGAAVFVSFATLPKECEESSVLRGFRDLKLEKCRSASRDYVEQVKLTHTKPGTKTIIECTPGGDAAAFCSFSDYVRLIRAVFGLSRGGGAILTRLARLEVWYRMSVDEKREYLRENLCHEVALFLLFKDPTSFANVVHPLIASRIQPDFLSLYMAYIAPRHMRQLPAFEASVPSLKTIDPWIMGELEVLATDIERLARITPLEAIFVVDTIRAIAEESGSSATMQLYKTSHALLLSHLRTTVEMKQGHSQDREHLTRLALNVGSVRSPTGANAEEDTECDSESANKPPAAETNEAEEEYEKNSPDGDSESASTDLELSCSSCYEGSGADSGSYSGSDSSEDMGYRGRAVGKIAESKKTEPQRFQLLSVTSLYSEMTWMDVGPGGHFGDSFFKQDSQSAEGPRSFAKEGWSAFWLDFFLHLLPVDSNDTPTTKCVPFSSPFASRHFLEPLISRSCTEAFVAYSLLSSSVTTTSISNLATPKVQAGTVEWCVNSGSDDKYFAVHVVTRQIVEAGKNDKENQATTESGDEGSLVIVKQRIREQGAMEAVSLDNAQVKTHYIAEYTILNLADTSRDDDTFQIVTQIPQGAVPLKGSDPGVIHTGTSYSKTTTVRIPPLGSASVHMHFFFPIAGTFDLPPAVVSVDGIVVGSSTRTAVMLGTLRGLSESSKPKQTNKIVVKPRKSGSAGMLVTGGMSFSSMDDASLLEWLRTVKLTSLFPNKFHAPNLALQKEDPIVQAIKPRLLASKALYNKVKATLAARGWYSRDLHLVGLVHDDWGAVHSLLDHFLDMMSGVLTASTLPFLFLNTPILKLTPFNNALHFAASNCSPSPDKLSRSFSPRMAVADLDPLVNERLFRLGTGPRATTTSNPALENHHTALLMSLAATPIEARPPEYKLWLAYSFLLQNRVLEASKLLKDQQPEVLHWSAALATPSTASTAPVCAPYIQLCCLSSFIELSVAAVSGGDITASGLNVKKTLPISHSLAQLPETSPVHSTIFGRYIRELSDYIQRLSGNRGDSTTTQPADGQTSIPPPTTTNAAVDLDEYHEKAVSYGRMQCVQVVPNKDVTSIHVSIPAEESGDVLVLFFNVSWETLLVRSDERTSETLIAKSTGSPGGVVVEEMEPDKAMALLIPKESYIPEFTEEEDPQGGPRLLGADVKIPHTLGTTPFIVGVRTSTCKTHFFKLMPQTISIIPDKRTGVLRVTNKQGKPLVGCYVRVMFKSVMESGKLAFWKDGYTDLVGRFDYATVSSQDIHTVSKFVIYAEHRGVGCNLQKADPPDV